MRRKTKTPINLDFAFFKYLRLFYTDRRGTIRNHYRELSKKFLDFNDPSESGAFLREPQFEALEMYIFLKEFLNNRHVHQIFTDWHLRQNGFEGVRPSASSNSTSSGNSIRSSIAPFLRRCRSLVCETTRTTSSPSRWEQARRF